ncbi:MAG TPA: ROK family protein [Caulobacteraceae bacterium]|nr:ROK family protein [Caulobacteraceae bacterium]
MIRIGIDFGGTKIEAAALDQDGHILSRIRRPNPGAYDTALAAIRDLVGAVEGECGLATSVGVGLPGSISPKSGLVRNANSLYLNGRSFQRDLEKVLGRPVRLANDANCLTLSEAADGAGDGHSVVFAAILGSGCGAGLVVDKRLIEGANGVAGEWGHMPLPWPDGDELPAPPCWCGKTGCMELYVSGAGLAADHQSRGGGAASAEAVVAAARAGEPSASRALQIYLDRLARGLAVIVNVLDPGVIVLGGGMSNVDELYARLPAAIGRWVFSDVFETPIVRARHGDSSGVRGAAWLWPGP